MYLKLYYILLFCLLFAKAKGQNKGCLSGDCINGFGHFSWLKGEEYIGNFKGGKRNGYGVFYWQNQSKYIGYWSAGKMEGKGFFFDEEGAIKKGFWKQNKLYQLERENRGLTRATIKQARAELQKIMADRPLMKGLIDSGDIVGEWVVYQLAGAAVLSPIYWQKKASKSFFIPRGVKAVHQYPTDYSEAKVWIKNTADAEQMWSSLIFELHNIRQGSAFARIEEDAKKWKCSKEEYIRRYVVLEHGAAQATKQFYIDIWLPFCESKGIKTNPVHWFYYLPATVEEWELSFKDPRGYPWNPYADYYDKIVKKITQNY